MSEHVSTLPTAGRGAWRPALGLLLGGLLAAQALAQTAPAPARRAAVARPAPEQPLPEPSQQTLQPGQQVLLPVGGKLMRVSIGQDSIADLTPLRDAKQGDSVLLRARSVGRTEVLIWRQGASQPVVHTVDVVARLGGLELKPGESGAATMEGGAPSLIEHAQGRSALERASGLKEPLIDASVVHATPSTVQVDVKVVEFSRSVLKEVGLNLFSNRTGFSWGVFSPSTLGTVTPGPALGNGVTNGSAPRLTFSGSRAPFTDAFNLVIGRRGLVANLSLLESNGLARVLAEPSLTALSGQSASFLAGGEIPIPVPQGLGSVAIEYKSFGIGLQVSPTVLSDDRIVLKVAPEASDLDFGNGLQINGSLVPAIITRRADTTVELGDGESFVIGGLVNTTTTSNVDKLPILGDLPILGSFFKNTRYSKDERELLIIVTPRLVRPIARGAEVPGLPGQARSRDDGAAFRHHLLGPALSGEVVPGFSR